MADPLGVERLLVRTAFGRIETASSISKIRIISEYRRYYRTFMAGDGVPNRIQLRMALMAVPTFFFASITSADLSAQQAALDAACDQAREQRLAPEREKYIEECVEKQQKQDRAACERFYSDYGARTGNRAPLYYDLPECVKAFEFRRNNK